MVGTARKSRWVVVFLKHLDDSELSIHFIVEAPKKKQKEYPQNPYETHLSDKHRG